MDISYYIKLLEENRNIVLTGAPGTGKTWLAKEIANKMNAEWTFVQFHPSYDYTDFVEGLRPIQDNRNGIVFERKDGVFKAFCKKAIEVNNLNYFKRKSESPTSKLSDLYGLELVSALETFKEKVQRSPIIIGSHKNEGTLFTVEINEKKQLLARPINGTSVTPCYDYQILNYMKKGDYDKKHQTYQPSIGKYILENILYDENRNIQNDDFDMSKYEQVSDLPVTDLEDIRANVSHDNTEQTYGNAKFVFIIDEINRGELSKIFGELFYAIDPGYRGKDGLVKTQYQNLVGKDDAFADGFYVPENVYIIATMNDIDRSVESMDFAMRRRFMWIEVTPDDRSEMLYDLKDDNICREAIARMHSLNEVIAETDGLGKSFQIGPAYFLKSEKLGFNLLWRLRLEPLLREYLRGFRNAEEKLLEFEAAYKSHATDNDSSNDVQP